MLQVWTGSNPIPGTGARECECGAGAEVGFGISSPVSWCVSAVSPPGAHGGAVLAVGALLGLAHHRDPLGTRGVQLKT